jgi:hypothetical protein
MISELKYVLLLCLWELVGYFDLMRANMKPPKLVHLKSFVHEGSWQLIYPLLKRVVLFF